MDRELLPTHSGKQEKLTAVDEVVHERLICWAASEDSEDGAILPKLSYDLITHQGWNGGNAIMLAAEFGVTSKLKQMIELIPTDKRIGALNSSNAWRNTALMLAAAEGHLDAVQLLVANGAAIKSQNRYHHTALMMAIERGNVDVATWLVQQPDERQTKLQEEASKRETSEHQLKIINIYKKNAVLVAAEFSENSAGKIIKWLLTDFLELNSDNRTIVQKALEGEAKNGRTPIFYACKSKGRDKLSAEIVQLMVSCGANAQKIAKLGGVEVDTCLMWAAKDNNVAAAKVLLTLHASLRPDVFFCSADNKTALSSAASAGKGEFVRYLVEYMDNLGQPDQPEGFAAMVKSNKQSSMKVAWQEGHVEVATYLMENLQLDLTQPLRSVFDEQEIHSLQRSYVRPERSETLKRLAEEAAKNNFHFELFLQLIPCYPSPSSVLNKQLPIYFRTLQKFAEKQNVDLIDKLVRLMSFIQLAGESHPMQKLDLQERFDDISEMLKECIASDCMDDTITVQKMLCCAVHWSREKRFQNALVEKAQAFTKGPLITSLDYNVSALFCTGHVATFVDSIFWGFLRTPRQSPPVRNNNFKRFLHRMLHSLDKEVGHLKLLKSRFIYFRYSPAMMFFGEAACRIWLFVVVIMVSLRLRGNTDLYVKSGHVSNLERMLIGLLGSNLLYEYGQICRDTTTIVPSSSRLRLYVHIGWNAVNGCALALVCVWAIFTFISFEKASLPVKIDVLLRAHIAFGSLASSTILYAFGLLRYLSIFEPVGKLVLMVTAMMKELAAFGLVFFVSCVGYCIAVYCMMSEADGFHTFTGAIQTLFSASLGNFDSSFHDIAVKSPFVALVIVIDIVFIVVSNVVLLNLIIARMTAVHEKLDVHSFQEYQLLRAVRTKRFLLLV
jgi:ankyrin repeat protein